MFSVSRHESAEFKIGATTAPVEPFRFKIPPIEAEISSEVGEVGKEELSNLSSIGLEAPGSRKTVVFETNDAFLTGEAEELSLFSSVTDLLGEKVSEDLLLLLLSGVETPEEPLKSTSLIFSGGEVTAPLDGDLDLSRSLEL